MSAFLYNFGISQEDERSEARALNIADGKARVLSICSAGEMPLSLLALGAEQVDAIDIDENQLHLAQLKRAALLTLEREEAIGFLGYAPASAKVRKRRLVRVEQALPPASRDFWRRHLGVVATGPIWAGRYERYVRRLVAVLRIFLARRLDDLFDCQGPAAQHDYFSHELDTRWLRGVFELAFHPRVFSRRGMDPRSLAHRRQTISLGQQYFDRFRALCIATPVQDNYLLQLHLLGRVLSSEAVPAYLSADGFAAARAGIDRLSLRRESLHDALVQAEAGRYNRFHLSNLPDWIPAGDFDRTMGLLAARGQPGGKAVWRFIHVDRAIPPSVAQILRVEPELGRELLARDRFPFYTIVPVSIAGKL